MKLISVVAFLKIREKVRYYLVAADFWCALISSLATFSLLSFKSVQELHSKLFSFAFAAVGLGVLAVCVSIPIALVSASDSRFAEYLAKRKMWSKLFNAAKQATNVVVVMLVMAAIGRVGLALHVDTSVWLDPRYQLLIRILRSIFVFFVVYSFMQVPALVSLVVGFGVRKEAFLAILASGGEVLAEDDTPAVPGAPNGA